MLLRQCTHTHRSMVTGRASMSHTLRRMFGTEFASLQHKRRPIWQALQARRIHGLPAQGAALLQTRRLIELRGPQASQFLQGLTTANIPSSNSEHPMAIYSAFLNAQGRLLQDVIIYHLPPGSNLVSSPPDKWTAEDEQKFLIEVDANQIGNLMRWLKKYKLRAKVAIKEVLAGEIGVFGIWDESRSVEESTKDMTGSEDKASISLPDTRAPGFGLRMLARTDSIPSRLKESLASGVNQDQAQHQYQARRYAFGIPEGQTELGYETALVHESNIDYMGGVDFRKGCYVGQELVIRTQHTGVVRKRILPCMLYTAEEDTPIVLEFRDTISAGVSAGSDIKSLVNEGKRARSKGKWLAGSGNLGLALCRLEDMLGIGPGGETVAGWEPKEWTLEAPDGSRHENMRVKAFVPHWWKEKTSKAMPEGHSKSD